VAFSGSFVAFSGSFVAFSGSFVAFSGTFVTFRVRVWYLGLLCGIRLVLMLGCCVVGVAVSFCVAG